MAQQAIPNADVRRLSSGRWLIPILATVSADGGSRFGVLARKLGVSRSVLSAQLVAADQFGWLIRNPGHGHPLRPEYLLTSEGRIIGAWCEQVMEQRRRFGIESTGLGRWSLPLLFALGDEQRGFSRLQRALMPVTPRALSLSLQQMQHADLVGCRDALYALTAKGRLFTRPLLLA